MVIIFLNQGSLAVKMSYTPLTTYTYKGRGVNVQGHLFVVVVYVFPLPVRQAPIRSAPSTMASYAWTHTALPHDFPMIACTCHRLQAGPWLIHPFIHPPTNTSNGPCFHPFTHSSIHPLIHSLIHWSIGSFIDPLIHPFIRASIDPFIHSFTHWSSYKLPLMGWREIAKRMVCRCSYIYIYRHI